MSTTFRPQSETVDPNGPTASAEEPTFAELYERYFPDLFDFVVRTMGDAERVSEVVTAAFVQTLMGVRQRRTPASVDAILFATARDISLDRLTTSSDTTDPAIQTFLHSRFVALDAKRSTSEAGVPDEDLAGHVWQLLSAHAPDEYSILDLALRRGMSPESLAVVTGRSADEVTETIRSLLSNIEDWITTALLIHRGSRECAGLSLTLDRVGRNAPAADLRVGVQRHLSSCDTCSGFRSRFPSAAETFIALAVVPAPDGVREAVWLDISSALRTTAAEVTAGTASGAGNVLDAPGRLWEASSLRQKAIAGLIGAIVIAVFITVVILLAPSGVIGIEDPEGFASTTHEIGAPTTSDVVTLTWEPNAEATGYSVTWSTEAKELPDDVVDLEGTATGTKSPELEPGEWYFHLRTRGPEGQWTSTVHLGPFVIIEDGDGSGGGGVVATPTPAATAEPTATPTTPEPTDVPEPGTPTPVVADDPCSPVVSPAEVANPTDTMGPAQTVQQYYLLLNERRYGEAYDLLTENTQIEFGPFSQWESGFASTTIVNPLTVSLLEEGADYAVVSVEVVAEDVSEGSTVYLIEGTWVLVTDGGPWKMSTANISVSAC
jgi:DNA-directed RNA polymerase specialized sigma24 family protein